MTRQKHLFRRAGYYYFRIIVPTKLTSNFGCKELCCSLRTTNMHEARYRSLKLQQGIQYVFMKFDAGTELKPEQVKKMVKAYFNDALSRLESQMEEAHGDVKLFSMMRESAKKNLTAEEWARVEHETPDRLTGRLDYLVPACYKSSIDENGKRTGRLFQPYFFNGDPDAVLKYVLEENALELDPYSPSHVAMKRGIERAVQELRRQHGRLIDFDGVQIDDDWFKENAIPAQHELSPYKLSECFEQYMLQKADEDAKTNAKRRSAYELWVELFGDGSISFITKDNVWVYVETLKRYPKNRKQKYDGLSLDDLKSLKLKKDQCLSIASINSYINMMKAFVTWLKDWKSFGGDNPFFKVNLKDDVRPEDKKDTFSKEQLIAIFSTPVYQGCLSARGKGQYIKGDNVYKNAKFWLPLLGLYSGARLGELCQLYLSDIRQDDDVWYFDINKDDDDKAVKTRSSFRTVPLHPTLIKLGFIKYVEEMKGKGEARVFPDISMAKDGKYSTIASKRFGNFLKTFGIKTKKTSFHSFRHTFINTIANEADVPEEVWEAITGHADNKKASRGYRGSDLSVKKKYEAIKKLEYPFLDDVLKGLIIPKDQPD